MSVIEDKGLISAWYEDQAVFSGINLIQNSSSSSRFFYNGSTASWRRQAGRDFLVSKVRLGGMAHALEA